MKKCAPSALIEDKSRPKACRQYGRTHQKALHVYKDLWFQCVDETFNFYKRVRSDDLDLGFGSRLELVSEEHKRRLKKTFVDTLIFVDVEILDMINNIHPDSEATNTKVHDPNDDVLLDLLDSGDEGHETVPEIVPEMPIMHAPDLGTFEWNFLQI